MKPARALQRALDADLWRQQEELRRDVIRWRAGLYYYNERLIRDRWGW